MKETMKLFLLIFVLNPYVIKCFEEIFIEVSIDEEQENGTLVVDLRSKIESLSLLNTSEGYKIKFVRPCLNIYFDEKNLFKIVSLKIDREEMCPYETNCYLICKILIECKEIKLIKLKININDLNDNKPKFNKKNYYFEYLNENLVKNQFKIPLEEAKDKDLSNVNSIKSYYLIKNENFPFKLNYNKENHLLELILIEEILENKKFVNELIVIDGKNEKDNCFIEINILENKENNYLPPKFDLNLYQFFIFNLNQNFIGQVNAKDPLNKTKQIYYRLISLNNNNLFEINQTNGIIYFNNQQKISFFNHFYQLFIEAFYFNYISSITIVHIYFNFTHQLYLNENYQENFIQFFIPKAFQNNQINKNQIYLKENSTIPLTILQLFISSSSSSSKLTMNSSIDLNYFYLKQLDQQSFELILLKSLDYEIYQNIYLHFVFNFTIKSIEIIILNINDCPPIFNQSTFYLQINENNQFPLLLNTFQAFDQDNLNNLTYQIQTKDDEDEKIFSINSTTGELWILKSFDREIKSNYSLLICVFDELYKSCSNIILEIVDENDNICKFNSTIIKLNINENLLSNTNLIQIESFDPDDKENGTIFYKFNSETSYLNINSTNGLIQTTINSFDYEFIQNYSIDIIGCDNFNSFPSFCCSIKLILNIIDINDNSPFLIYPKLINHLFIINYTNKIMPQLKAFDNDIFNPIIFFQIIGGSLNSSLTIDYYSGQLNLLSSSTILPIYGSLIISISSQTIIHFYILIHDNQTNPQLFLKSIQQSSSFIYSPLFYFSFISFLLFLLFIFLYFIKQKIKHHQQNQSLINTPSTTTLSNKSLSTSNHKKIYETYYSFGDSVFSPQIIHL